jgi:hypothetical protein
MTDQANTEAARRRAPAHAASALLVASLAALLGACSSGSGGTDVTIGSGQNADPVTLDFPVFYVKRPTPDPEDEMLQDPDARELLRFEIGADLFMRDRASPSAPETNLTGEITGGLGDIRDVNVNFEGTKVVFAMRARFIEGADEEDQPTWNLWEYDIAQRALRRVIASDNIDEEGHDIMPSYLPDGRILFTSTRQRTSRAILLDENKPQYAAQDEDNNEPAFVLHVMDADGENIRQISFNQSHDRDPSVLANGQVVFTRWERAGDDNQLDIFRVNPDGSGLELLYGAHSHDTGAPDANGQPTIVQFLQPKAMPNGRTLALVRPFQGTDEGGDLLLIDTQTYVDNTQPTLANAGLAGPAQTRALPTDVRTIPGPSPGGRYRSAQPMFDGTDRLLVSWSQCRMLEAGRIVPCTSDRLNDPDAVEAPPLYGLYVYDTRSNTQQPILAPQEGFIYTDVVAASTRALPPVILDRTAGVDFDASLSADNENVGILNIRSVYDFDGGDTAPGGIAAVSNPASPSYAARPARFVRVEKAVSQPDEDVRDVPNTAFGPAGRNLGMRDILGYAPVEPDGSVKVKVPASVPFMISVLDANGRRVGPRHTNWLQVTAGEELRCNGCHNPSATPARSHGRAELFTSVNSGAPASGLFPNTNSALLDGPGRTMAETRWTVMCDRAAPASRGGNCELSVNLMYDEFWSPTPDPALAFDACYVGGPTNFGSSPSDLTLKHNCRPGLQTPLPTSQACADDWRSGCRVTIHYESHIHPLWQLDRFVDANNDGVPDVDPMGQPINHKCQTCHAPTNPANAAMAQVPPGQLDLTDGPSEDEAAHFKAYRELLFTDNRQVLDANGQLVDEQVQVGVDPVTGEPQFAPVPVASPMSAGGANASARFFNKFNGGGTVDHGDFMSPSELRLLSEWLDIGAQYYNDPFVAPEN